MEVFVGTIQSFAFPFAPRDWALCSGMTLSLSQNQVLFALLGTTYGGNGTTNFMLPNLQGRLQIGQGNGLNLTPRVVGEFNGVENVTLTIPNIPAHSHTISSSLAATTTINLATTANSAVSVPSATNSYLGASGGGPGAATIYSNQLGANAAVPLSGVSSTLTGEVTAASTGSGTPVSLMNPFLAVNFSIALSGIFPSRN